MSRHLLGEPQGLDLASVLTKEDLGRALALLRTRARMSVRQVSKATGVPVSTLGEYFRGAHLPRDAAALVSVLRACGVVDLIVIDQWLTVFDRVRVAPGPRPSGGPEPYMGLKSFQPQDAEWFFGRERSIAHLLERMGERLAAGDGLLIVVGPSGSGKSSLLRAGLIPAVAAGRLTADVFDHRTVLLISPGEHPVEELAASLATALGGTPEQVAIDLRADPRRIVDRIHASGQRLLLVVDQFEEAFIACQDDVDRRVFIAALCAAADSRDRPRESADDGSAPLAIVVIGLRADFYAHVLRDDDLARKAQYAQVVVEPMTVQELRHTITGPAQKAKLELADGLVDLLLRDIAPPVGQRPPSVQTHDVGVLPLLSHALLATWQTRRGARMTIADYVACGGVHGAVAHTADQMYAALDESQRTLARQVLVRLTHVTDDTITRRRMRKADLLTSFAAQLAEVERLLGVFAEARLITISSDTVEIAHDAVLSAWPQLYDWIDADRAGLRTEQRLTEDARSWEQDSRDPSSLYRGGRLAAVRDWVEHGRRNALSPSAREFFDASMRVERRRTQRAFQAVAGFALVTILALTAGAVAWRQRDASIRERDAADSRTAAARADQIRGTDPALAAQLSLAAFRISQTPQALSSLLDSSATPVATRLTGAEGTVHAVAYSPDGQTLVAGGADHLVRLWDVGASRPPTPLGQPLRGATDVVTTVAFSADGRLLAAAGHDKVVHLWDNTVRTQPTKLEAKLVGATGVINSVAFSPSGTLLAVADARASIYVWDVSDPRIPAIVSKLDGLGGPVNAVAFSPDGRYLASGNTDKAVRLWDVTNPRQPALVSRVESAGAVNTVAFSRDGRYLAAGSSDMTVRIWDVTDPRQTTTIGQPLTGAAGRIFALAFSSDGASLAAGSADESVRVWDLASSRLTATLPHPGPVTAVAFGQDPARMASGAADGIVRLWTLPSPILTDATQSVFAVAFSPASKTLAAGSSDGTVRLWDTTESWQPIPIGSLKAPPGSSALDGTAAFGPNGRLAAGTTGGAVLLWRSIKDTQPVILQPPVNDLTGHIESVTFSHDGDTVAASNARGGVQLWSIPDGQPPTTYSTLPTTPGITALSVAFSPNAQLLAAASADKTVWLWDISDPNRPRPMTTPLTGATNYVYHVIFSPDGKLLAAGSADGTVRLWDMSNAHQPRPLGAPLMGPKGYIYSIAFAPDGRTLATASTDKTVWIWDIANPRRPHAVAILTGPTKSVFSVAISPDGRVLAAGGRDATVRIWHLKSNDIIERSCRLAGDPITRTEWHQHFPNRPHVAPCGT